LQAGIRDSLICLDYSHKEVSVEEFGVAPEDSLRGSIDIAVKHYSSLFRLPSGRRVSLLVLLFCMGGGLLSTTILFPTFEGLRNGLLFGLGLFFVSVFADCIISGLVLKKNAVFDLRRTMALSVFCWAVWLFFVFIGAAVGRATLDMIWWLRLSLLGFSATLIVRFVVFNATSSATNKRLFAASLLQPSFGVIPFLIFWTRMDYPVSVSTVNVLAFFISSVIIGFAASFSFLFLLNQMGKQAVGVRSIELFRAFVLSWVSNLNAPFEEILEKLGEEQEVEVCLMKFGSGSESKAVLVVPSVHPGPFKNIGSSLLPAMIKTDLEKTFGCVACVPHGLFGHEYDLASQIQNRKIIAEVVTRLQSLEVHDENASPFVTISNGLATACCQIFGKCALISFTLAPKTIEDLPQELGRFVREEAEKRGLSLCTIVNAHNSIDGTVKMQEALHSLEHVATKCLDKALSLKQSPFEVGVASLLPKEFGLEDGMGSGGITVTVVKSGQQKAAYVVIDGNNMVSGLRERILSSLSSMGIDGGEVLTTDTHAVNALTLSPHGYHPVGEAIDNEKLIGYVKDVAGSALARLEPMGVSSLSVKIPKVRVIGAEQVEALCLLTDKAVERAKRVALPVFGASGLLLMLLLLLV
jgi:putative membrane protein